MSARRLTGDGDHWHLVTYGLSELDAKESEDPAVSGWGFELTVRIAAADAGDGPNDPPLWAVDLLTNLAAYVWSSGHGFEPGHHIDLGGPIRLGTDTALTAAVTVVDPGLGVLRGPNGRVRFLQVVALTADELEACRAWDTAAVLDRLAASDPRLTVVLDRPGLADGPVRPSPGGPVRDLRVATLRIRRRSRATVVQLGAGASAALGPALRRCLVAEGDDYRLIGDDGEVRFVAGTGAAVRSGPGRLEVTVPPGEVAGLAGLFDGRCGWGSRPAWPALRWRVVP